MYGRRCGGMTGVMLGQSVVPAFLLTVHGLVRPIGESGCHGEGPRGSLSCQRAPRVPRARQKYTKGIWRAYAFVAEVGRGRSHSRRAQGSGALMTSRGLGRGERRTRASCDIVADTLLSPLIGYAYY
jgi:hypothetical protein